MVLAQKPAELILLSVLLSSASCAASSVSLCRMSLAVP